MDERQQAIKRAIEAAVNAGASDEITYKSEWLGYLPFGVYHWVDYLDNDLSPHFPADWSEADLASLARAGFLQVVETYQNPEDEYERHVRYRVALS